jgi:hypothetical protein
MGVSPLCVIAYSERTEVKKEQPRKRTEKEKAGCGAAGKFNREVSDTLRGEVEEDCRRG